MLRNIRLAAVALAVLALAGCAGSQLSEKDRATLAASDEWRMRSLEEKSLEQHNAQLELAGQVADLRRRLEAVEQGRAMAPAAPKPLLSSKALPEPGPVKMAPGADAGMEKAKEPADTDMERADAQKDASRWDAYPDATEKDTGAAMKEPAAKPSAPKTSAMKKPAPKMAAMASGAKAEYDKALKLVLAGKAAQGRRAMQAFMGAHPKSSLTPNALYWLGETYYHEKNYAEAVVAFKKVHQRFPRHEKAAAALLKIGYSYAMLGDKGNARFYLQVLTEDYPKSQPAALGRKRLATLK